MSRDERRPDLLPLGGVLEDAGVRRGLNQRVHIILATDPAVQRTVSALVLALDPSLPSELRVGGELLGGTGAPESELLHQATQPRLGSPHRGGAADRRPQVLGQWPPPRHAEASANRLSQPVIAALYGISS